MPDLSDPLDRRPLQSTPVETPGLRGLLAVAVAVVVVAGLYLGRSMLIPITLAVLLSFLLAPSRQPAAAGCIWAVSPRCCLPCCWPSR